MTLRPASLLYAFALAPLLVAADTGQRRSALTIDGVPPPCQEDEFISMSDGKLTCIRLAADTVTLPDCSGALLSTTSAGDVAAPVCVAGGPVDLSQLTSLETRLNTLVDQTNRLTAAPGTTVATFVGLTTATTVGRFDRVAADNGLVAAAGFCNEAFAGAHMCSVWEIYASVVTGKLNSTMTTPKAWIYFPASNNPIMGAMNPLQGMADNCASYTYPTADHRWTGVALSTGVLSSGSWGVRFHGGTEAACNQVFPIACCK